MKNNVQRDIISTNDLHIVGSGDNSSKIICVHGGPGMDYSYFLPYLEPLAEYFDLVFYKIGSFSDSPSIDNYKQELIEISRLFAKDNCFVLAHSFGSSLAIDAGSDLHKNIKGLMLISWIHSHKYADFTGYQRMVDYSDEDFKKDTLKHISMYFNVGSIDEGFKALEKVTYDGKIFAELEFSYLSNFEISSKVKQINIPTLSIAGQLDEIVPIEHIKAGLQQNNKIKHIEFNDSKHFPFIEQKEVFIQHIRNFVVENLGGRK